MQSLRSWIPCVTLVLLAACDSASGPPLIVSDIVITEPPPGRAMSAGYLTLSNPSGDDIRVTRVTSPQFESVEIHESLLQDGIASMQRVPELLITARSSISLQPGGKHLMLMRPIGEAKNVSLNFYSDEILLLSVQASTKGRNN